MAERDATASLSRLIDRDPARIREALERVRAGDAYERFEIPKLGSKSARIISAPIEALKDTQRGIITLVEPLPLSSAVHGFRRGRSIVTGAKAHLDARSMINIDLKDFFFSVDDRRTRRVLTKSLVPRLVEETGELTRAEARRIVDLIVELVTHPVEDRPRPVLPQGAPSSTVFGQSRRSTARCRDQGSARSGSGRIRLHSVRRRSEHLFSGRAPSNASVRAPSPSLGARLCGQSQEGSHQLGHQRGCALSAAARSHRPSPRSRSSLRSDPPPQDGCLPNDAASSRASAHARSRDAAQQIEGVVSFVQMVYGGLPPSLRTPYERFTEAHQLRPIRPGKSRRLAKARSTQKELYP